MKKITMKKITLFLEDEFFEILQDFKKNILRYTGTSDEKAMTLVTRYFMKSFNKN